MLNGGQNGTIEDWSDGVVEGWEPVVGGWWLMVDRPITPILHYSNGSKRVMSLNLSRSRSNEATGTLLSAARAAIRASGKSTETDLNRLRASRNMLAFSTAIPGFSMRSSRASATAERCCWCTS